MPPSNRRRRPADDEESDEDARPRQRRTRSASEEVPNGVSDEEEDEDGLGLSADDQMAKKLVRYAISCEFSRTPIRRDGIKERVLGNHGRSFRRIFELAQKQLRDTWGMELRELPLREKMSLQEKRAAMKSNSQQKSGSGAYILSSTLPEAFRAAAILAPSKTPSAEDEATYVAFCTMVVSMILLNSGELSEQKLQRYLARLNADRNVSMDKTEVIMKNMERQGYVIKKVDKPPVGQDGDLTITWHVGPRAKEEIGLDGVIGMVTEVYEEWNEDLEKKLCSSLNIKARKGVPRVEEDSEEEVEETTVVEE